MRIDVLTLFPDVMQPYLTASIMQRASHAGLAEFHLHQLRDYSNDPHRKVDDRPFGGGPGMVLMCQPVCDAVEAIEKLDPRPALRVLLTPQGRRFDQSEARRLSGLDRILLICGHYEGFDERIITLLKPHELSVGDFVLTGGEIAALAVIDAVVRLIPGALGCDESAAHESFETGRLDHPHYTRPRDFRGMIVPDVLLSGNHADIARWRESEARGRTTDRRPDLNAAHGDSAGGFSPRSSVPCPAAELNKLVRGSEARRRALRAATTGAAASDRTEFDLISLMRS